MNGRSGRGKLIRLDGRNDEQERSEQCSPLNSAADRIRIWERRHQLPLPRNPTHVLLADIAAGTGLTLEDVQAEQRVRAESRAAAGKA